MFVFALFPLIQTLAVFVHETEKPKKLKSVISSIERSNLASLVSLRLCVPGLFEEPFLDQYEALRSIDALCLAF